MGTKQESKDEGDERQRKWGWGDWGKVGVSKDWRNAEGPQGRGMRGGREQEELAVRGRILGGGDEKGKSRRRRVGGESKRGGQKN